MYDVDPDQEHFSLYDIYCHIHCLYQNVLVSQNHIAWFLSWLIFLFLILLNPNHESFIWSIIVLFKTLLDFAFKWFLPMFYEKTLFGKNKCDFPQIIILSNK
jgi:hypothetical protein